MGSFKYKTYRCEWQVQVVSVNPNDGLPTKIYSKWSFGTRDEAIDFRKTIAEESRWVKDRWIPINASHCYCEAIISYQEVLDSEF